MSCSLIPLCFSTWKIHVMPGYEASVHVMKSLESILRVHQLHGGTHVHIIIFRYARRQISFIAAVTRLNRYSSGTTTMNWVTQRRSKTPTFRDSKSSILGEIHGGKWIFIMSTVESLYCGHPWDSWKCPDLVRCSYRQHLSGWDLGLKWCPYIRGVWFHYRKN